MAALESRKKAVVSTKVDSLSGPKRTEEPAVSRGDLHYYFRKGSLVWKNGLSFSPLLSHLFI